MQTDVILLHAYYLIIIRDPRLSSLLDFQISVTRLLPLSIGAPTLTLSRFQVEDPGDLFAEDPDSGHDSDDSNAESYYANSYPDEDTDREDDDDDDGHDGDWCYVRRGVASRGPVGPGQVSGERWDDEEYDLTRDSDGEGPASGGGGELSGGGAGVGAGMDAALARLMGRRGAGGKGVGGSGSGSAGAWGYRIR